jgi:hypothetical protein
VIVIALVVVVPVGHGGLDLARQEPAILHDVELNLDDLAYRERPIFRLELGVCGGGKGQRAHNPGPDQVGWEGDQFAVQLTPADDAGGR